MDAKDVFDAQAVSIEAVLREPGRGLYIPSYQRQYAWKKEQARALISSICEGVTALGEMSDAITFIGTFIFVHDKTYSTIEPQVRHDLPAAVYLVIDGQQRLSTLCMIAVALHDAITQTYGKVKHLDNEAGEWMRAQQMGLKKRLERMFALDKDIGYGDVTLQYYPRMIRAHVDSWSNRQAQAKYNSPIASIIRQYVKHWQTTLAAGDAEVDEFRFEPTADDLHIQFAENYRAIKNALTALFQQKSRKSDDDDQLPSLRGVATLPSEVLERYFAGEVPGAIKDIWAGPASQAAHRRVCELSRMFLFCGYFLNRVAVTQVLVKKEEYAFDLFEALNTTGEPLTAYETFKPLVIKSESLDGYQMSESAGYVQRVELFLNSHGERRREASDRLLVPFALFSYGKKLGKGLRDQRNWLRSRFEEAPAGSDVLTHKRDFLRGMAVVADFLRQCWPDGDDALPLVASGLLPDAGAAARAEFCLTVLRHAKHEVTVATLARFYEQLTDAKPEAIAQAAAEFVEAVAAVTAFYALWRGSRVGTENIDAVYRRTMQGLIGQEEGDVSFPAMNRSAGHAPSAQTLKSILLRQLVQDGCGTKEAWVERASTIEIYKQSLPLTKLLLLAAAEDTVSDPAHPGLPKRGKPGCAPALAMDMWKQGFQVEHIAPKKGLATGWDQEIYAKARIDCIGNLVLLPGPENASVSNRAWPTKRLYYQVLSSPTFEESADLVKAAKEQGVDLSDTGEAKLLASAKFLPHLRSVAMLEPEVTWTTAFIDERSRQTLNLAWESLAPWLGVAT